MKKKRYLPFGYQMEKGEIIPHPDEGPLVQAIFSKYLERTALSTLAKYASLSGIPYREGAGQWNKAMVCRILDNSKYAGDEGFPPLISKEQLEEAAFLRAAKAKQYGGSLPVEMKKIRQQICCGNCGQILKRVNMRTGYILWECPKCGISTDYIPDELLLQSVTALLNRAIKNREKLKPEDTRKFMENAFRDGEIKTAGTDIDKIMPPISRFGGGGRAKKKLGVIEKLRAFFEKYFGIGGSSTFTEPEHKMVTYDLNDQETLLLAAEPKSPYGKQS